MERPPEPIKVLHITFNMGFGGTEQVIVQLVSEMRDAGVSSSVLCIDGKVGALGLSLQKLGMEIFALSRSPGFNLELVRQIHQKILVEKYDVVHCHQYTPFVYGRLAAVKTGARVVFTEHGRFHPDRYRYKAALINWLLAITTPAIVTISSATREALSRYEFIPVRRIQVIYNGIRGLARDQPRAKEARASLGIPENAFLVGTVSRLDPVKNQKMMIRAFKRFYEKNPNAYLLFVGDGPERGALEKQAKETGLAQRIVFTGYIEHPVNHLAALDLFLLSSYTEGTSMTLLEAMSLGVPIVATRVGGNPEIVIEGETGLLVESDDDGGFAEAMVKMSDNLVFRDQVAGNSRARFTERFTASHMAAEYLKLYARVTDSSGSLHG